jgi:DNA primase
MRLMQIGLPTVALLGIQLSSTQLQLLRQSPRIVLMLDGDDAGQSASRKIANALTQHTAIRVHRIELPQGLDPDDLSDTDLTHRLHPCFS